MKKHLKSRYHRALFVGRFQPFHRGHEEAIRRIFEETDELIIVVGSAEKSHELENPFTAGERVSMIRAALDEMRVPAARYYIIPIPDASMHATWTTKVIAFCPSFDVVYSNEPLTRRLFKEVGRLVKGIPLFDRESFCATEIRKRILLDEDWTELVPSSVVAFIEKVNGVDRLKELSLTDSPFTKREIRR